MDIHPHKRVLDTLLDQQAIAVWFPEALSPEQAAQAKRRLIEGHLWLAVRLVKRSGARL